jgi:hypothetical protein
MKVTVDLRQLELKLKTAAQIPKQLIQDAYDFFHDLTPIDTGTAQRNTRLTGSTIQATYAYASVLDAGRRYTQEQWRGSRQAPRGMTEPTTRFMRSRVRQLTNKV